MVKTTDTGSAAIFAKQTRATSWEVAQTGLRWRLRSTPEILSRMASGGALGYQHLNALFIDPSGADGRHFDYRVLLDLAYFLAGIARTTEEYELAMRAFDFARKFGDGEASRFHQRVMTNLYLKFGENAKALAINESSKKAGPLQKWIVRLYAEQPRHGFSEEHWINVLNWPNRNSSLAPMILKPDHRFTFDDITVDPEVRPPSSVHGPLVTVIMSVFQPTHAFNFAIDSLIAQTWSNLEIIVVDDGGDFDDSVLIKAVCEKDPRIRYLKADSNGGTYRCRNLALRVAAGKYVGFQDDDDWSHPQRIEVQVNALEANEELLATWCTGIQLTDDLWMSKVGRAGITLKHASLVFRRDPVLDRMGNFDAVRKSADGEFIRRIKTLFGENSVHLIEHPMYLYRVGKDSLSHGDFQLGWWDFGRWAYRNAYVHWQDNYGQRIKPIDGRKPFYAPAEFDHAKRPDVAVAFLGEVQDPGLAVTVAGVSPESNYALIQGESLWRSGPNRKQISQNIWPMVSKPNIELASLNHDFRAKTLFVIEPEILNWLPALSGGHMQAESVVISALHAPHDDFSQMSRYDPLLINEYSREVFGVSPLWVPRTKTIENQLINYGCKTVAPRLLLASPVLHRMRHRGAGRPVVGFSDSVDPSTAQSLNAAGFDVRVLTGKQRPLLIEGVQRLESIPLLAFLDQIDVAVLPGLSTLPNTPWHAASRGVIPVIQGEFDADTDSPFIVSHGESLADVVKGLLPELAKQQEQAWLWAKTSISPEAFRVSMNSILQKGHS